MRKRGDEEKEGSVNCWGYNIYDSTVDHYDRCTRIWYAGMILTTFCRCSYHVNDSYPIGFCIPHLETNFRVRE